MAPVNGVILQPFQWYTPSGTLWKDLARDAQALANSGYTAIWFPPPGKGAGGTNDVGYGAFDLFDLGEFDQKFGAPPTKYGTRDELLSAVKAVQKAGMQVYIDTVFNQKDGGDDEVVPAQEVDWNDRNQPIGDWHDIKAYTRFGFAARAGKYSTMAWSRDHFDAVSYDGFHPERGNSRLFRLKNKSFSTEVSPEKGNYDYLSACDLETINPVVEGELRWWGRWIVDTTGVNGFRLDAVKHIRAGFTRDWLNHLRCHFGGRELFSVGEYWSGNVDDLHGYITTTQGVMSLFDVPLHYRFCDAGNAREHYDLRRIFDRTLVREQPALAVTFVDNHDSQPCQSLESWVQPWFKPLAYALILLRREGYPCVFAADLRESDYTDKGRYVKLWDHSYLVDRFLWARRAYGFGDQNDYLDHPNTIGWARLGSAAHPGAMAVVLSNGDDGYKWMEVHRAHATFYDLTGHLQHKVTTNELGWGCFPCKGRSVSVWLQE
jgi:alpha-amylase